MTNDVVDMEVPIVVITADVNVVVKATVTAVVTADRTCGCRTGIVLVGRDVVEETTIEVTTAETVVVGMDCSLEATGRGNRLPEGSSESLVGVVAVAGGDWSVSRLKVTLLVSLL